ncbi:MAG TPA: glycine cleavage T C-terminal barrel domain-containing protein [Vicinamibacterales bacterium]|nr:glycine cleavage T C-terminal barrel domain-containing protein [Vicinamibacterales bacterium]
MFSLEGYTAVTANGGVVRRVDRGVLAVSGADRVSWLQGLLTNDIASLKEGESRYSAYLTPQGRMISDMHVFALGDRLLLDVPLSLAAPLRDKLDGLIFSEDARVTDESARVFVWTVIRQDALIEAIGETIPQKFASLTEIVMDTFDVIRIERGVPRFLVDMNEDTIPLEAGIEDRAISFSKGCYVGQEVIVRVTTRGGGRVAKKLVRWVADASADIVPLPDSRIFSFDKDIGRVTSAAFSPNLNRVVGLGYVHRDHLSSGTEVTVKWNDSRIKAAVQ